MGEGISIPASLDGVDLHRQLAARLRHFQGVGPAAQLNVNALSPKP
jgi:hypothetical protein